MAKNIIMIVTDTFRYDNLKERAQIPVRTPELDQFAKERATEISKYYMGSFPTIPHRTDLATGVTGWPHYGWQSIELSSSNHIAKLFGEKGYATQLICDCPHLFNAGFPSSFDAAYQHRGQEGDKPLLHLNDQVEEIVRDEKTRTTPTYRGHNLVNQHRWTNRYFKNESQTFSARTSKTTIQWLEENYTVNPFFLWVDLFDPHEPWDPPEYMVKRYDPSYNGPPMLHPNYGRSSDYSKPELRNLWAHYAAESELVDRHIGSILKKIDDLDLWQDSIVLVLSDHGISLGEHGRTGKSNIKQNDDRYWPIYPEIGHGILMLAGGDIPRGKELPLITQTIDILPSLCDLAGISIEPPQSFDGRSFASAVLNQSKNHREFAVSGCHILDCKSGIPRRATTPFLITEQWGYAPLGAYGENEIYHLSSDSLAENDLSQHNNNLIKELYHLFKEHLIQNHASEELISLWDKRRWQKPSGGKWATDYT